MEKKYNIYKYNIYRAASPGEVQCQDCARADIRVIDAVQRRDGSTDIDGLYYCQVLTGSLRRVRQLFTCNSAIKRPVMPIEEGALWD